MGELPDKDFLRKLLKEEEAHVKRKLSDEELFLMYSGALMNWLGDYLTDDDIVWERARVAIDTLTLTGTNPEWNKIIIDKCGRSPARLRLLLEQEPATAKIFSDAKPSGDPILVNNIEGELRIFNGMHRTIAAMLAGEKEIDAFVARSKRQPRPKCEPHVVYDMLRAYQRGLNRDKEGLVTALRFLKEAYSNVEVLLKDRFSDEWVHDEDLRKIIKEI